MLFEVTLTLFAKSVYESENRRRQGLGSKDFTCVVKVGSHW